MKVLLYAFLLVITAGTVNKCDDVDNLPSVGLNEEFDLELNSTMKIKGEDAGITFTKNVESRCPVDVNCIRAGEAATTFKFMTKDKSDVVVLEAKGQCQKTDGSCGESKTSLGYNIQLISVSPYPGTSAAQNKDAVKARLRITK